MLIQILIPKGSFRMLYFINKKLTWKFQMKVEPYSIIFHIGDNVSLKNITIPDLPIEKFKAFVFASNYSSLLFHYHSYLITQSFPLFFFHLHLLNYILVVRNIALNNGFTKQTFYLHLNRTICTNYFFYISKNKMLMSFIFFHKLYKKKFYSIP
jgi:hypothetical protein